MNNEEKFEFVKTKLLEEMDKRNAQLSIIYHIDNIRVLAITKVHRTFVLGKINKKEKKFMENLVIDGFYLFNTIFKPELINSIYESIILVDAKNNINIDDLKEVFGELV